MPPWQRSRQRAGDATAAVSCSESLARITFLSSLPTLAMGLDLSPMVVILALYFLKEFLVPVLHRLAMTLEIG